RAVVGLFGPTYQHLKNNVLPSVIESLKWHGYTEHKSNKEIGNFIKFRKPPNHWIKPYHELSDYENVISFSNGYSIILVSWFDA
ncbi:hypothetical protein U2063_15475, partial [Listeria monocytogenes]|uniref:hypothetical protein n=1 Tax=Listeria monocytogenes TaxID=1639 RepID=UPI002FDC2134